MGIIKVSKVHTFLVSIMMMAILLCCSSQVQAAQEGDYTYSVTDGKAQITGYTGVGGVVTIPSTLGGVPVTSLGNEVFYSCTGLKSITIPEGVTSIGEGAFENCTGLTSIRINSAKTAIDDRADTISATTKIIGYDPSTAKTYATKYGNAFEVISATSTPTAQWVTRTSGTSNYLMGVSYSNSTFVAIGYGQENW